MPRSSHTHRRDSGSVLPMALVLVVVFGAVAVALASYTATALRTTTVTNDVVDRLAAAESGMQTALATTDSGTCAGSTSLGVINRAAVTTTCVHRSRVENADGAYALVITGVGVDTNTEFDTSGPGRKCVGGPVYFETGILVDVSGMAAVSGSDCALATAQGGEVRYNVAGGCTDTPPPGPGQGNWLAPAPTYSCDARGWAAVAPAPTVPVPLASLPVLAAPTGTTCKVYAQGQRIGGTLDLNSSSFFGSGIYYFKDVTINIGARVTAGKRTGGSYAAPAGTDHFDPSCQTAWNADPGTGAVFVLAGTTTVNVNNGGRLGMYPMDLTAGTVTGAVSVISFNTTTLGYEPSSLDPDSVELISRHNGSTRSASFYGLTYVPRSWVDTGNASANAYIQFIGGLVAARASIRTEPPVGAFSMFVPSTLIHYYLLESTAAINGTATTVRVVSKVDDTGGLEVLTWRVK